MPSPIVHNMDGKYNYEDSLSLDTGGRKEPEPIPSAERVKLAIRQLEIGWWEGLRMRTYYAWRRFAQAWKKYQLGRVLWISAIVLLIGWCGWVMVEAAFDWLWKGLGTR